MKVNDVLCKIETPFNIKEKLHLPEDPLLEKLKLDLAEEKEITVSDIGKRYHKESWIDVLSRPDVRLYLLADLVTKKFGCPVLKYNPEVEISEEDKLRFIFKQKCFKENFARTYDISLSLLSSWINGKSSPKCCLCMKLYLES